MTVLLPDRPWVSSVGRALALALLLALLAGGSGNAFARTVDRRAGEPSTPGAPISAPLRLPASCLLAQGEAHLPWYRVALDGLTPTSPHPLRDLRLAAAADAKGAPTGTPSGVAPAKGKQASLAARYTLDLAIVLVVEFGFYTLYAQGKNFVEFSFEGFFRSLINPEFVLGDPASHWVAHGSLGTLVYMFFKARYRRWWIGALTAFLVGTVWEVYQSMEEHRPDPADMLRTALIGIALGELMDRLAEYSWRRYSAGGGWGWAALGWLNPFRRVPWLRRSLI